MPYLMQSRTPLTPEEVGLAFAYLLALFSTQPASPELQITPQPEPKQLS
ncbi:hypothetical protein [Streptomyces canus]|nr:hypothetical protein [Streptomyces canus]